MNGRVQVVWLKRDLRLSDHAPLCAAAAALPVHGLRNAALIIALNDLFQTRHNMGFAMVAKLDHNPATPHLMCHGPGSARPRKRIEDYIISLGRELYTALDKTFRLFTSGKFYASLLGGMMNGWIRPPRESAEHP